ncbi:MAG: DegT/DnrJ/EryC1/StrS family aminotransferase [Bacteroidetes bacterium]|nr:DegT/DnrJ/EryC1/StrS family aminotransferase [Bacteroidota bacterium]
MIPYEDLKQSNAFFKDKYLKATEKVIDSGWFILGNEVSDFEKDFAQYCQSNYCAGVASGLDALILSLKSLDLQPHDEVIVPSNTYIATILAIVHCGLKPVLVEPNIDTYNIDPLLIESQITQKTKVIMLVHLYGKACDMNPIIYLANKYQLKIIEDCAQSHGAKYNGKMTGTFGYSGAFSFYPTKNLGALGDAGAVISSDKFVINRIKTLRNYGSSIKYNNVEVGYNSRLDELQAAILNVKLSFLDEINNHKRHLATLYFEGLKEDFIKPSLNPSNYDVYHIFNIRHPKRDELKKYLEKNDIMTEIHYPIPPHQQKAMKGIIYGEYPISTIIHQTTLSLPISYFHTDQDIFKIIDTLNKY